MLDDGIGLTRGDSRGGAGGRDDGAMLELELLAIMTRILQVEFL